MTKIKYSEEIIKQVKELFNEGFGARKIAKILNSTRDQVKAIYKILGIREKARLRNLLRYKKDDEELIGKKFGKLTILEVIPGSRNKRKRVKYICECGTIKIVTKMDVTRGHSKSCGCMRIDLIAYGHRKREPWTSSAMAIYKKGYDDGDITFEQFLNLSQQECYYCGAKPSKTYNAFKRNFDKHGRGSKYSVENGEFVYNGIDRIDNTDPVHNLKNSCTCCSTCNYDKRAKTQEYFEELTIRRYRQIMKRKKLNVGKEIPDKSWDT